MPPIPLIPPGIAGAVGASFFGISEIAASVVKNVAAILDAFCKADRVTFLGFLNLL